MLNYPFKYLEESICVSINPTTQGEAIMDQFSTADRTKFSALKALAKQQEFLWSRSALLQAGAHLGSITYLGKKPITNEAYISLSHCQEGVSAAYSKDLEVGIDIETRRGTSIELLLSSPGKRKRNALPVMSKRPFNSFGALKKVSLNSTATAI